MQNVLVP